MSACRADRAAAALLAAALFAASAAAQEPPAAGAPLSLIPGAPAPAPADGVIVDEIGPAQGDSAGALGPGDGGFGADLWRGSDGARLMRLMARAAAAARSPAVREPLRRALASAAAPPPGSWERGAFLAARLDALLRLGAFEDAERTAEAAGEPGALRPLVEAAFWRGDLAAACAATRAAARERGEPAWRRALVLCQAAAGETETAALTLALLQDEAEEADLPRLRLAARLLGQIDSADAIFDDGPGFAASVAAGLLAGAETARGLGPAAARAAALRPELDMDTRLAAAERAAALGALAPRRLAEIYGEAAPEAGGEIGGETGEPEGPRARALFFRSAAAADSDARRAALLASLWAPAPDGPGFAPLARAAAGTLRAIAPDPGLAWFAPAAIRAALAIGAAETAAAWYRALSAAADGGGAAAATARWRAFLPVAALGAATGLPWTERSAAQWWSAMPEGPGAPGPEERGARAERGFTVIDALGRPVGVEGWALFLDAPPASRTVVPNIGLRYGMRDAARAGRVGEALLLAALVLGGDGPAGASPLALGAVLRALRALGLESEARAIAAEALIGDIGAIGESSAPAAR